MQSFSNDYQVGHGSVIHRWEFGDLEDNLSQRMKEQTAALEGVGKDVEIVTNSRGGKQSKSPMAMHLIDPVFLEEWAKDKREMYEYLDRDDCICIDDEDSDYHNCYEAIEEIAIAMQRDFHLHINIAMSVLENGDIEQLTRIAKVLQYGASRYEPNNWRLIPQEEHINHALIHIIAHLMGDTQDDHIDHALCRLMMAYSTEKSDSFEYGSYVDKKIA